MDLNKLLILNKTGKLSRRAYNFVNCIERFDRHALRHNFKPENYRPHSFPRQMSHNSDNNNAAFFYKNAQECNVSFYVSLVTGY